MELRSKLTDPARRLRLYGTTPPRTGTPPEQVRAAVEKLAARLSGVPLDALVVYDIQDETGLTQLARPFPFVGTVDPRSYGALLQARTARPIIVYKALGKLDEPQWNAWLFDSAHAHRISFVSAVGRPSSGVRYALPLSRAIRMAVAHAGGFTVGGVVIAERHTAERSESARLLAKGLEGCAYFISQTVYHAPPTQRLLADYLRDCRGAGVEPRRVVLTFAPCGREKTMAFIRWLGVHVPAETEQAIFGAAQPLQKSLEICCDNLRRILDAPYSGHVPIGVNVESVSINRDEIDASVDLFHALREVLAGK